MVRENTADSPENPETVTLPAKDNGGRPKHGTMQQDLSQSPMTAGESHVELRGVSMAFGTRPVLDSLTCRFPPGGISTILGGSGSGKSTVLRLIGGLIRPQAGEVRVDGDDVTRLTNRGLREVRKKLGMVFQGGALLDSYTVFDNLALPLRERTSMDEKEIADEVHRTLQAVGVEDAGDLLPGQLSGGMLRRVALGRAIIRKPVILLCDEPFSGLDPVSCRRIEALLKKMNQEFGMTLIVVSHDVRSTMRMADRLLLLLEGRAFEGTPEELRTHHDADVAAFLQEGLDGSGGAT
jgi:phospholipid/cholesterol/gamma-HCH transport system ATP-binding protein